MTGAERALARIDVGAIERNCPQARLTGGSCGLCAVVKADGYGHGAAPAAEAALRGGATWLAVATAAEARGLREHGIDGPAARDGRSHARPSCATAVEADADVVAWTRELAEAAAALGGARAARQARHRHGTARHEGRGARALAPAATGVAGVMTHFATADEPGDEHFPEQLERFTRVRRGAEARAPEAVVHAANSAATFRDPAAHFDMVRCGVAIYGLDPFQGDPRERGLEPALALESWVAALRRFEPGDGAGYGRRWRAPGPTWVATVPIGYGDGWRRGLSNDCDVLIGGRRYPLVGTVSMDNITVDVGPGSRAWRWGTRWC